MNFSDLLKAMPLPETSFPMGSFASSFDITSVNDTIERALTSAGLTTQTGPMKNVMETIQQSLAAAGLSQHRPTASEHGVTIDGVARKIFTPDEGLQKRTGEAPSRPTAPAEQVSPGQFVSRSYTNDAGTRTYKLYVPASYSAQSSEPVPLVVMLHGCTQSPDDFAAGTRMNALAEKRGFLVAYPAQAANANGSKCWNWFRAEDQERDRGEPSLIAGITREVVASHRVDERRVFVAGLSSGAAMAVTLGVTYPEIYAAVGAHSGLPYGAAHDMPSAFAAMKGSRSSGLAGRPNRAGSGAPRTAGGRGVPTIVFHGDRDHTVDARNGAEIVDQAIRGHADAERLQATTRQSSAVGGRQYSHTVYADAADQPVVEQWVLHGAGHAWSGGSPKGSFTDKGGPDASAEMIRFFYSQPRAGTA